MVVCYFVFLIKFGVKNSLHAKVLAQDGAGGVVEN